MESDGVNAMFQKHLIEDGALHYGEFMNDLSKTIVSSCKLAERLNYLNGVLMHIEVHRSEHVKSEAEVIFSFCTDPSIS